MPAKSELSPDQSSVKTEQAWTSGEWTVTGDYQGTNADGTDRLRYMIDTTGTDIIVSYFIDRKDDAEARANANLLAAAKEMYEALIVALPYVRADTSAKGKADYSVLRRAMAKARGEQT